MRWSEKPCVRILMYLVISLAESVVLGCLQDSSIEILVDGKTEASTANVTLGDELIIKCFVNTSNIKSSLGSIELHSRRLGKLNNLTACRASHGVHVCQFKITKIGLEHQGAYDCITFYNDPHQCFTKTIELFVRRKPRTTSGEPTVSQTTQVDVLKEITTGNQIKNTEQTSSPNNGSGMLRTIHSVNIVLMFLLLFIT